MVNVERLYKKLIIGLGFIFLFVLSGCGSHVIEFNDKSREIEINSIVDYYQFIEEVNNGDIKDVVVDDSQVKLNTLGKYTVTYSLGDKSEDLEIEIVDTIAPKVTLKEKTILYDYDLKADELIDNVTDTTLTTASFKKKYHFKKPGDMEVVVVV